MTGLYIPYGKCAGCDGQLIGAVLGQITDLRLIIWHGIQKVLFIHGLASSGAYKTANTLRTLLRPCVVVAPDVPIEPGAALSMLRDICRTECPDLVVGLSLGGFWAIQLRGFRKILINPDLHPSRLLRTKIGEMKYLSPRQDGALSFEITEQICEGSGPFKAICHLRGCAGSKAFDDRKEGKEQKLPSDTVSAAVLPPLEKHMLHPPTGFQGLVEI